MEKEENEKIDDFFNWIITHRNVVKNYGETISDEMIVEKVLRTLTPKFDHIVVTIEESKNIEEIKIEELQGSLVAHDQRITKRSTYKSSDNQDFQEYIPRKGGFNSKSGLRGRGCGRDLRSTPGRNSQDQEQEKIEQDYQEVQIEEEDQKIGEEEIRESIERDSNVSTAITSDIFHQNAQLYQVRKNIKLT